jgi:effector-binding domain-containing protein
MPDYEVSIKSVDPQLVAALRDVVPNISTLGQTLPPLFEEVYAYVAAQGGVPNGPAFDRYLDTEHKETDLTVEACAPITVPIPGSDRVRIVEIEGESQMACAIHRGPFQGLSAAFNAVMAWIGANGYRIVGPCREVYVEFDPEGDSANWVTEVQIPVAPV